MEASVKARKPRKRKVSVCDRREEGGGGGLRYPNEEDRLQDRLAQDRISRQVDLPQCKFEMAGDKQLDHMHGEDVNVLRGCFSTLPPPAPSLPLLPSLLFPSHFSPLILSHLGSEGGDSLCHQPLGFHSQADLLGDRRPRDEDDAGHEDGVGEDARNVDEEAVEDPEAADEDEGERDEESSRVQAVEEEAKGQAHPHLH